MGEHSLKIFASEEKANDQNSCRDFVCFCLFVLKLLLILPLLFLLLSLHLLLLLLFLLLFK